MRVIGIDPGLRNLGWGVIDTDGSRMSHVANGIVHGTGEALAARLLALYEGLTEVVAPLSPPTPPRSNRPSSTATARAR